MNKAIFLDRDGVLNHPKKNHYVYRREDFELNIGVVEALRTWQERGFMLIVITNQGGVSKGAYSREDVEDVHRYMVELLENVGIEITEVYYCPHHPKLEQCLCRKPQGLMIEKGLARFDIDPEISWFIGDKKSDEEAGENAGVQTLRIRRNRDLRKIVNQVN